MVFNLLIKDLFITVEEYRPLAEALAVPNIVIPDDLDTNEFVINEDAITPLRDDDLIAIG